VYLARSFEGRGEERVTGVPLEKVVVQRVF
jgi:hypothetical protein